MTKYKRIPIKNHHQEVQLTAMRSMYVLIFISIMILLLILRLAYLQVHKNELYSTLSTKNWLDLVPVEPTRGLIYDRNGVLLADNIGVFSLDITPYQVADLPKTLIELKKIISLSSSDLTQFEKQRKQHRRFDEIPLKLRLTEEEVQRFAENQYRFPGIQVKARLMRRYPYGSTLSHVMGFVGRINTQELNEIDLTNYSASHYIGKSGIEKYYEDDLHGQVGYQEVENDARGKPIRILKEIKAIPGKNIYLTIDYNLQTIAEKALQGHRGAIVAIEPDTGQVLAMVSEPSFDPNAFVVGISHADYKTLQESPDRPLYDRAVHGLYPPASTIKPYFALEGLNAEVITPQDTIDDPGWFELNNSTHRFHDWRKGGHGTVNMSKAITSSCDTYFFELSVKLGIQRMDTILSDFGFGAPTGIDLDNEQPGVVPSPEWKRRTKHLPWYPADVVMAGIGQGYLQATPLQLASAIATLATRGQRFMPYLQLGMQQPNKPYVPQQPIVLDTITLVDNDDWNVIIKAMQNVVDSPEGTAYRFGRDHRYTIAAKTGTAQVIAKRGNPDEVDKQLDVPERLRDHHLFIAFAPVDKPKIALAIITENSNTAIDAARLILDYYLANHPGTQQHVNRQPETDTKETAA